jgi:hypothetical protein
LRNQRVGQQHDRVYYKTRSLCFSSGICPGCQTEYSGTVYILHFLHKCRNFLICICTCKSVPYDQTLERCGAQQYSLAHLFFRNLPGIPKNGSFLRCLLLIPRKLSPELCHGFPMQVLPLRSSILQLRRYLLVTAFRWRVDRGCAYPRPQRVDKPSGRPSLPSWRTLVLRLKPPDFIFQIGDPPLQSLFLRR